MKLYTAQSTVGMTREQWLAYRMTGIGGSDAAAIMGATPYKTVVEVWKEKVYNVYEDVDNIAMRRGVHDESFVADEFERATGIKTRRLRAVLRSSEYPFMLANIDRQIAGNIGLEIKTTGAQNSERFTKDSYPVWYTVQMAHYMTVTGWERWYLAALDGYNRLHIYEERRDDEKMQLVMKMLVEKESEFWQAVQTKTNIWEDADYERKNA